MLLGARRGAKFPGMRPGRASVLLLLPCALRAHGQLASAGEAAIRAGTATGAMAIATRAASAPVIDGREDDEIWAHAQLIDDFRQFVPKEDSAPTFRTTAKVAYDDKFLYVFVRMYDPHPDSIIGLLSRRDVKTQSDWIKLIIDSYHDRRTGYELAVNPRGVKRDYYTYDDQQEDESWDGIWDVETRIDSAGWTAEFRIPFDQMRFSPAPNITMGFGMWRDIARLNERDSWPVYRYSKQGISSQMGEITGIQGLGAPRHLEITPYAVTKSITYPHDSTYGRQQQFTAGADLKYGVTSNLTLDGTINPDFGQVESDPAVLNLSNFETFLPEKRPFFVEGMGIFHFDMSCNNGACSGLFYSRRIGRQPQLSNGEPGTPTATSILGAAKLTGRTAGGLSVGILDAYTARAENAPDSITGLTSTAEPPTNYLAAQLVQEFRDGQTSLGAMVTATNRQNDAVTQDTLRDAGYAAGVAFQHQFANRTYQIRAWVVGSRVDGSDSAIALTQLNSAHYYQRPGSGLAYDPSRTSLSGDAEKFSISKIGGGVLRWWTGFTHISPGFEINDLGYLQQSGVQVWSNWVGLEYTQPTSWYRTMFLNFNETNNWTAQALSGTYLTGTNANFNGHIQLKNSWSLFGGLDYNQFFGVFDATKARGGPAMFRHPFTDAFIGFEGDPRLKVIPSVEFDWFDGSGGLSHGWGVGPQFQIQFSSSTRMQLGVRYDLNWNYQEWVGNGYGADTVYTFATIDQNTISATVRFDATFTPRLSFQFYAQPYISDGRYENWRKLDDPRATSYSDEFQPFTNPQDYPNDLNASLGDYDFTFQELNVNAVLRWEYRPGSALYFVWTHGRSYSNTSQAYQGFNPGSDVNNLFAIHPMNTFLIKATYRFGT